jgi:hypothetical protein
MNISKTETKTHRNLRLKLSETATETDRKLKLKLSGPKEAHGGAAAAAAMGPQGGIR